MSKPRTSDLRVMMASKKKPIAGPGESTQRADKAVLLDYIEQLTVEHIADRARIEELENSIAQLLSAAGLDSLRPKIEAANYRTIKQTAYVTGFSESNVRKLIGKGKLIAIKKGGRVLIAAASIDGAKRLFERTSKPA